MGGENTDLQSSSNLDKGGINIKGQLRQARVFMGPMISMMSKEYCDKHEYEIQPLD